MANFITILLVVTVVVDLGIIPFIYRSEQTPVQRVFALFVIGIAGWAAAILSLLHASTSQSILFSLKLSYIAALFLAACFYCFSLLFSDERSGHRTEVTAVGIVTALFSAALLLPNFLTGPVISAKPVLVVGLHLPEYVAFATIFCVLFLGGLVRLWRKFWSAEGVLAKQLLAVAGSVSVTGLLGIYYNLVLPSPFFENFQFVWTGPALTALFAIVIDYSIFRYHLFNAKALVAEFLVFALWIIMAVRGLTAETVTDRIGDVAVLVIAIPIGVLLLRAMRLEVKTREVLAAANERLIELDRMKSEFLSFATHQLRGPLAVIRGYSSELAEGTFGALGADVEEAVERIDESARGLASIIDDYLNVSRLEQGHMKFDIAVADIRRLSARVVTDYTRAAAEKHLALTFTAAPGPCLAIMDAEKIRQVLSNLLDNALKYTPSGSVAVEVQQDAARRMCLISVRDTGIGIDQGELPKLFEKFVRAPGAGRTASGSGIGLYVAKELVEGQGGKIWAELPGLGHGTKFHVELPMSQGTERH